MSRALTYQKLCALRLGDYVRHEKRTYRVVRQVHDTDQRGPYRGWFVEWVPDGLATDPGLGMRTIYCDYFNRRWFALPTKRHLERMLK